MSYTRLERIVTVKALPEKLRSRKFTSRFALISINHRRHDASHRIFQTNVHVLSHWKFCKP